MILDDAILELFDQGIYSPATIDQMLHQRGKAWIRNALMERSSQLIRPYVRELAGKRTVLLAPRGPVSSEAEPRKPMREVYGPLVWVMGKGYMPQAECTSSDLRSAAAYLRQQAADNVAKAEEYEQMADDLDRAGAKTVADLEVAA